MGGAKYLNLDEDDILLLYRGDPTIVWCYTSKFNRSFHIRDEEGSSLICINLRDDTYAKLKKSIVEEHLSSYIDYILNHELVHWCYDGREISEEKWDKYLIALLDEIRGRSK